MTLSLNPLSLLIFTFRKLNKILVAAVVVAVNFKASK